MGCFRVRVGARTLDVHHVAVAVETADKSVLLYKEPASGELNAANAAPADFLGYISEVLTCVRLAEDHPACERSIDLAGDIEQLHRTKA